MQGTHASLDKRTFFGQEHLAQRSITADLVVSGLPDERFEESIRLEKIKKTAIKKKLKYQKRFHFVK